MSPSTICPTLKVRWVISWQTCLVFLGDSGAAIETNSSDDMIKVAVGCLMGFSVATACLNSKSSFVPLFICSISGIFKSLIITYI